MMLRLLAPAAAVLSVFAVAAQAEPTAPAAPTASPGIVVQGQAEAKERKVCHMEVATGSVMPKRVCRTVSSDPTARLQEERELDRVRDRQQYGQSMGQER
jgi:hypothetical protein